MITIGGSEIHLINESRIVADPGGIFGLVPRALWSQHYTEEPQGGIAQHHICLLVRAEGQTIVVDTGQGHKNNAKRAEMLQLSHPQGTLLESLARLGVMPDDVTLVINTHLHGDHCGGNTYLAEDGSPRPTFPNARYITQRLEYADAAFPNERTRGTYFSENFAPLYQTGQLRLLDGDYEPVWGMRCVITPGHTRAHMSIVFEGGGQYAMFVADLSTVAVLFARLAWMTAYDVEPLVTLETKRIWQRWALEHNALLIFQHDPVTHTGRLVEDDKGRLSIQPESGPEDL